MAISVTVNNPDWGEVTSVSAAFSYEYSITPEYPEMHQTVSQECSGTVTQYTAVPKPGYRFLTWTNISSEVHEWWRSWYKRTGEVTDSGDKTYIRTKTGSDTKPITQNPLGYTLADTQSWGSTLWPPLDYTNFQTPPHQIGLDSYVFHETDQDSSQMWWDDPTKYDHHGENHTTWRPISLEAVFTPIRIRVRLKYRKFNSAEVVSVATLGEFDAGSQVQIQYGLSLPSYGDTSFRGTNWAWNRHWKDEERNIVYREGDTITLPKPEYTGEDVVELVLFAVFRECTLLPMYLPSNGLLLYGSRRGRTYIIRDGDPGE